MQELIIHHISTTANLARMFDFEGQRALGLAEVSWFTVSFADRDLFFRDREVVAGSGVNAGSLHPGGVAERSDERSDARAPHTALHRTHRKEDSMTTVRVALRAARFEREVNR